MNRRTFIAAVGASVFAAPVVANAAPNTCVVMEERDGAFVIEGKGKMLSEPFAMAPGTYRLEVELSNPSRTDSGFWIDFIAREDGEVDDYFAVSDSEGVPEISSGTLELTYDGEYLAEQTSFRGDWKVVLSPL